MLKTCKNCGKEITTEGRALFCCADCQTIFYSKDIKKEIKAETLIKRICKYCGKEFETTNKKRLHCNEYCKNQYKYRRKKNNEIEEIKKNCIYCGTEFETKNLNKLYCSSKCAVNKRRTCKHCGKIYFGISEKQFCSVECMKEHRKKIVKCKICGNEFETSTLHQKYCSDKCFSKRKSKKYLQK